MLDDEEHFNAQLFNVTVSVASIEQRQRGNYCFRCVQEWTKI